MAKHRTLQRVLQDKLFKALLEELYDRQRLTMEETARRTGINSGTLRQRARELGFFSELKNLPPSDNRHRGIARRKTYKVLAALGLTVPRGYHTHHLDGNPDNNDPENVMVVTKKQHSWIHARLGLSDPTEGD
jgi:hypothetical protein